MHILLVNDDGPPSNQSSPYIHTLAVALQSHGHQVSIVLPNVQRSWIGKAHIVGQNLTPSYFRPGSLLKDDGVLSARPFTDGGEEWVLLDGTPASCVGIGIHHLFNDRPPIDLVLSGPNYGRNTTAVFALSSGTLGAAMEGAIHGKRSIALSYAFDSREHDLDIIKEASELSVRLVEKLVKEWPRDVHLYSVNVPLRKGVSSTKIVYAEMIQNQWVSGSTYDEMPEETANGDPGKEEHNIRDSEELNHDAPAKTGVRNHVTYKWAPKFADVRNSVEKSGKGDGWEVLQGNVTVTPLRANFWHLPQYSGEIKLDTDSVQQSDVQASAMHSPSFSAVVDYPEPYVQELLLRSLKRLGPGVNIVASSDQLLNGPKDTPLLQFTAYEALDFDHAMSHPTSSLICAYAIRKALIRKHYLSNTVATWLVKHPDSPLAAHFKPCTHFELDFAEFLDDALVDAWDLNSSLSKNQQAAEDEPKEWWILKPGMSDGANGLRLNRKFHIRAYILAVGALKVYVYKEMLALFAARPYTAPPDAGAGGAESLDLTAHLTNTCFQDESTKSTSDKVFSQICTIAGEVFEAAAREQMVHFQAIPNAFEIFGVDFLVDDALRVYLLELNAYPDFKQTGAELQDVVVGGLFDDVVDLVVAPFFSGDVEEKASISSRMVRVKELDLGRH
ncbi:hypothetical protein DV735_g4830, partial [Chaetothyriales sp. CBS 134920]